MLLDNFLNAFCFASLRDQPVPMPLVLILEIPELSSMDMVTPSNEASQVVISDDAEFALYEIATFPRSRKSIYFLKSCSEKQRKHLLNIDYLMLTKQLETQRNL